MLSTGALMLVSRGTRMAWLVDLLIVVVLVVVLVLEVLEVVEVVEVGEGPDGRRIGLVVLEETTDELKSSKCHKTLTFFYSLVPHNIDIEMHV